MPKDFSRTLRVSEVIHRELASILQREAKDPELKLLTITDVEVSKDLSYAKVYVSSLEVEPDKVKIEKKLESARGYLRKLLAQNIELRSVPELRFYYDSSVTEGNRIASILDKLK